MLLTELFDTKFKWTEMDESTKYDRLYYFMTYNKEIVVNFTPISKNNGWEVSFGEIDESKPKSINIHRRLKYHITGTGDELGTISTVVEIIKYFLNTHQPNSLIFHAENLEGNRARVYQRIMQKVIDKDWVGEVIKDKSPYRTFFKIVPRP